jgi:hypothetical protein
MRVGKRLMRTEVRSGKLGRVFLGCPGDLTVQRACLWPCLSSRRIGVWLRRGKLCLSFPAWPYRVGGETAVLLVRAP